MSFNLKPFLIAAALATGGAAHAATCDASGYDPDINGVRPGSCPTDVTYSSPQAIDYAAPIEMRGAAARHDHSAGGGSGESKAKTAPSEDSMVWLETIWTGA